MQGSGWAAGLGMVRGTGPWGSRAGQPSFGGSEAGRLGGGSGSGGAGSNRQKKLEKNNRAPVSRTTIDPAQAPHHRRPALPARLPDGLPAWHSSISFMTHPIWIPPPLPSTFAIG
jgi:hypothetical protein